MTKSVLFERTVDDCSLVLYQDGTWEITPLEVPEHLAETATRRKIREIFDHGPVIVDYEDIPFSTTLEPTYVLVAYNAATQTGEVGSRHESPGPYPEESWTFEFSTQSRYDFPHDEYRYTLVLEVKHPRVPTLEEWSAALQAVLRLLQTQTTLFDEDETGFSFVLVKETRARRPTDAVWRQVEDNILGEYIAVDTVMIYEGGFGHTWDLGITDYRSPRGWTQIPAVGNRPASLTLHVEPQDVNNNLMVYNFAQVAERLLKSQVPLPEGSIGIALSRNWDADNLQPPSEKLPYGPNGKPYEVRFKPYVEPNYE